MEYDKLQLIESKAKKLLDKLRSDIDIPDYKNAFYWMLALYISALVYLYVVYGYEQLIYAVPLIVGVLINNLINSTASKEVNALAAYETFVVSSTAEHTTGMLRYLASVISMKSSRLKALRIVYMILFPFFLMMMRCIIMSNFTDKSSYLIHLVAAVLIGTGFWFLFFKNEVDDLEMDKIDVVDLIEKIKS